MLSIRLFPDPILRKKAAKITVFDSTLTSTIEKLDRIMRAQVSGIGIAAPQVGLPIQLAIVDVSGRVSGAQRIVLINPIILSLEQEKLSREGCMSLPEYTGNIKRYECVKYAYQQIDGKRVVRESSGIEAICVQHEIDHLQGRLFLDHIVSLKRDLIPRPK